MRFLVISLAAFLVPALGSDYRIDIKPMLKKRCVGCHGPLKQKSGLRLDTGRSIHEGGKNGAVLDSLIERVTSEDEEERMPPEGPPLSESEVRALKDWIDSGGPFPEDEIATDSPESHWSFQPIEKPEMPPVSDPSWPHNPIDAFLLAGLDSRGWRPAPEADPPVLLRRVHLDLIGLPPTIEEQDTFSRNPDLDRVIDELLDRPGYGERWARHWLDTVRYADTNGYERDAIKPFVWRYRDYVIDSLNDDKPWDRFLIEQIAGDELPDRDAETVIATGYLRLGHWDDEPADPETDRYDQLDDILNTTSQAMLGLTLACARCHDHKFEPLSQRDYYSMIAVFDPLQRPRNGRTELAIPAGTREEVAALERRDAEIAKIRTRFEREFLESGKSKLPEDVIAAFLDPNSKEQKALVAKHLKALDEELEAAIPNDEIDRLKASRTDLPLAYAWEEPSNEEPETHVLVRGAPGRHGIRVFPATPAVLSPTAKFPGPGGHTTRRRLGFANWIVDPANPLAARVIVNRVWMHHFGEGLVRTPTDFGLMGEPPSHPELLDWLSHWFVHEADWSLKELHRLILTSRAWRMSSRIGNSEYHVADPENRHLSRQNHRRLEVEAIRDSILAVSGKLNREMHGPHTYPSIPAQALEGHSDPEKIWKPLDEKSASRRTVYAFVKRSLMLPMLEVLDICDTTQPSSGRRVTTVPTQALTLFNSEFANRQAHHLAERLRAEAGDDPGDQVDRLFRLALCRHPEPSEKERILAHLREESLAEVCRVVFNLNEFVYPE
jgi:cytochrome c553